MSIILARYMLDYFQSLDITLKHKLEESTIRSVSDIE